MCKVEKFLGMKTLLVTCVLLALLVTFVQKLLVASVGEVPWGLHHYVALVYLYCWSFWVQIGLAGMLNRTGVIFLDAGKAIP